MPTNKKERTETANHIQVEEELKAIRRGECPVCRFRLRHPEASRCRHARWYDYLWDCRTLMEETFGLDIDEFFTAERLKDNFERGDTPSQIVLEFGEKYDLLPLGRQP
jgi:hypothetical protein